MKTNRKQILICICLALPLIAFTQGYGIRINRSESLPQTVFIALPVKELQRGQIVSFTHPQFQWPLAKVVVGLPRDQIKVSNEIAMVNGQEVGTILQKSSSGRSYTPIAEGSILEGYCYVSGSHPESYDSRYAEFGLVDQLWIKEQLWPLF